MKVETIKTRLVRAGECTIFELLRESIKSLPERAVVALSSKVVALCEGRVVPGNEATREELMKRESERYVPGAFNPYGFSFAVTKGTLIPSAGIDGSNGDGNWVLWPKDPQISANEIREFLAKEYNLKEVGVIITDSTCLPPLRRGTIGIMIAWSGFEALNDLRGKKDLFGREFEVSVSAIAGGLAAAATVVMGEGDERTPIAVVTEADFVKFTGKNPSEKDLADVMIPFEEDLFYPFLKDAPWQEGGAGK